jgi:hypothetical protein
MEQSDPLMGLLALFLVIGVPALIFWRLGWFEHQKEKTDFGFDKPEKMRSWEGLLYVIWNWKAYTAKVVWIVGTILVWYESDLGDALTWFIAVGILILIGRFWELFR